MWDVSGGLSAERCGRAANRQRCLLGVGRDTTSDSSRYCARENQGRQAHFALSMGLIATWDEPFARNVAMSWDEPAVYQRPAFVPGYGSSLRSVRRPTK